ncbi:MAG TPA: PHP domain-containing protein [Candidatus Limnocylindria bacterium]|nr:PHP domain-containing protein [Candidatus Limnocylindria bacterium]
MLRNHDVAELLSREARSHTDHRRRALERAARAALWRWTVEAAELVAAGRPLTELELVGPWLATIIGRWLADPPSLGEPSPLRTGFLTLADARATLDAHPDWAKAYRGDLQMHTTWSDGAESLEDMVSGAAARGYEYVAVTDHSQGLRIANGMSEEKLRDQWRAIEKLRTPGISVLRGLEMNLAPDGTGDMSDDVLSGVDVVLGAFHSQLRLKDDQTDRYLRALANPTVNVLAHPRGRRYDVRYGLLADWERVSRAAAEHDVALEIDSWPDRQDLDVENLRAAAAAGCRISIDTDAHASDELRFVEFGLAAAIRAGIQRERIVNFLPRDELLAWSRAKRRVASR